MNRQRAREDRVPAPSAVPLVEWVCRYGLDRSTSGRKTSCNWSSSAPMSGARPEGRASPSKSAVTRASTPASWAAEPLAMW